MRDEVGAGVEHALGVIEIEEMDRDAQPLRVRLLDDRAIDVRRHLGRPRIVDADLDDVDFHRRVAVDERARLFGRLGIEHRTGDEQPRAIERGRALIIADSESRRLIVPEREHRRHAVRGVCVEVAKDVRGGIVALRQRFGVADMAVRVDEARNHRLAGERDALRAAGNRHARGRTDRRDPAVVDENRRVVDRRTIGSVDHAGADEGDVSGRRAGRRPRYECQGGERPACCFHP